MLTVAQPAPLQHDETALLTRMNGAMATIGREFVLRWRFSVARIAVSVAGFPDDPALRSALDRAAILGFAGLSVATADEPAILQALERQRRMLMIRLDGRSLVAFQPERDLAHHDADPTEAILLRASAWGPGGRILGRTVRRVMLDQARLDRAA
jgi:hypothetical protein